MDAKDTELLKLLIEVTDRVRDLMLERDQQHSLDRRKGQHKNVMWTRRRIIRRVSDPDNG